MQKVKRVWLSPNGKYRVVGIQFTDEITPTIFVQVKGRKTSLTYDTYHTCTKEKLPKYVVDACESIKQELTFLCNHCKSN
ncbi:hypothetical protein HPK10_02075 [Anoxybacillus flavithermus]|uniref:hypothetical protein n=1 Tax=Anoxybacillus flavithermus TaxID=33934 RepID=UPI0018672E40|nr:hypothetical protein [Anoxybacillus flavithermus]MBE2941937.1 hypothetical protein [Anoxybacillus flavithermus]MBE2950175.1 hypothetical protein [Anoxybacillus flavithermus]MBE2953028.1 hypothetical protein [Anoxybacillus flavithermus]MBE2958381.1 hypothetical protein [Anoxybacillus flavithermus]